MEDFRDKHDCALTPIFLTMLGLEVWLEITLCTQVVTHKSTYKL